MAKAGRPREFKEDYIRQARIAFQEGFTDVKFCELIGIARDTFVRWRREYPEFGEAVQQGKDEFDTNVVEASLKKRALGFRFTETTREPLIFRPKGGTPELLDGEINENSDPPKVIPILSITKKVGKLVVPDTTAIIFWLKNRRRDRWKDIKAQEVSGPGGGPIEIDLAEKLREALTQSKKAHKET